MPTTDFKRDCPHCLSKGASFSIRHQWEERGTSYAANLLAVCGVCNRGILILARSSSGSFPTNLTSQVQDFPTSRLYIEEAWPDVSIELPDDMPPSVQSFYLQGIKNLAGQNWDAAGAMFRKALDVSTKILVPEHKKKSLFARIEKLVSSGKLTEAMGEWSHEIRLDGNDAVHDEEPESENDAQITQKFTEAFLRYSFTLPSMVARNRAKRMIDDNSSVQIEPNEA